MQDRPSKKRANKKRVSHTNKKRDLTEEQIWVAALAAYEEQKAARVFA